LVAWAEDDAREEPTCPAAAFHIVTNTPSTRARDAIAPSIHLGADNSPFEDDATDVLELCTSVVCAAAPRPSLSPLSPDVNTPCDRAAVPSIAWLSTSCGRGRPILGSREAARRHHCDRSLTAARPVARRRALQPEAGGPTSKFWYSPCAIRPSADGEEALLVRWRNIYSFLRSRNKRLAGLAATARKRLLERHAVGSAAPGMWDVLAPEPPAPARYSDGSDAKTECPSLLPPSIRARRSRPRLRRSASRRRPR